MQKRGKEGKGIEPICNCKKIIATRWFGVRTLRERERERVREHSPVGTIILSQIAAQNLYTWSALSNCT